MDGSVGLAGAAFGEEVAAPVAGALVRGHGDALLAGGGALGQEVVAGVDTRPAGALFAARLLRPCVRQQCVFICCIQNRSVRRQTPTHIYIHED